MCKETAACFGEPPLTHLCRCGSQLWPSSVRSTAFPWGQPGLPVSEEPAPAQPQAAVGPEAAAGHRLTHRGWA